MKFYLLTYVLWPTLLVTVSNCVNLLSDCQFHCWPLTASAQRPDPYPSCPGVTAYWVNDPVRDATKETLKLTYFFAVNSSFYPWAVRQGIFDHAGPGPGFSDAARAKAWCEGTQCPGRLLAADESNCCLHYVNVHFCPPDPYIPEAPCRPWLPAQGTVVTHSTAHTGPVNTHLWTSELRGADDLEQYDDKVQLLVVFKLAGMVAALEAKYYAEYEPKCGDGRCQGEEDCQSCSTDCGHCTPGEAPTVIYVVCISILLLIFALALLLYYCQRRHNSLADKTWIVEPHEIFANELGGCNAGACAEYQTDGMSVMSQQPIQKKNRFLSALVFPGLRRRKRPAAAYIGMAHVRGQRVAVKKYYNEEFQLTPQIRTEVKTVRQLVHPNLCQFIGGTVHPGCVYILYEYCSQGSLIDLMNNEDFPLNWAFRFSLLADVSRGMAFLHKHNVIHGNLKSSNCVVDDRWTCKVTDFGLTEYRRESSTDEDEEELRMRHKEKMRRDGVYRAPEADTDLQPASDVFSFAVIMVEVATRERIQSRGAQCGVDVRRVGVSSLLPRMYTSNSTLDALSSQSTTFDPYESIKSRESDTCFVRIYQGLINRCWADKPASRPNFVTIGEILIRIHPNKKSPVDTMIDMMQMYSKNLEQLVEKRSRQVLDEKRKSEALLFSILPPNVAKSLQNGKPVRAEWYEASTVFFSDIVGFTALSGQSTPMQIVELLNKLYTSFDSVIERYNVYKVETIGDAYMVVSGVPNRTSQHAYNVAMMALDIIKATKNFVIPHLPKKPLLIRVGLHSGPVCAGVVGVKMPRYCLFGDTVNTASFMESSGRALRVHISNATYEALEPTDKFRFDCRGHISVKGKGELLTWWLLGQKDQLEEDIHLTSLGMKESHSAFSILSRAYRDCL